MEAQGEGEVEKRQQGLELVEVVHGRKKVARKGRGRAKREKKCERMEKAQVMEPREDGGILLFLMIMVARNFGVERGFG